MKAAINERPIQPRPQRLLIIELIRDGSNEIYRDLVGSVLVRRPIRDKGWGHRSQHIR